MGQNLKAVTFPDLLCKRYESRLIRIFTSLVIFFFMPLYAGAVLIGAARFLETALGLSFMVALVIFTFVIALYVVTGGIKGGLYTDAFQGSIMFLGMSFLLILTYYKLGGVTQVHSTLADMAPMVPEKLQAIGHQGWAKMPQTGSELWWVVISTLVLLYFYGNLSGCRHIHPFQSFSCHGNIARKRSVRKHILQKPIDFQATHDFVCSHRYRCRNYHQFIPGI